MRERSGYANLHTLPGFAWNRRLCQYSTLLVRYEDFAVLCVVEGARSNVDFQAPCIQYLIFHDHLLEHDALFRLIHVATHHPRILQYSRISCTLLQCCWSQVAMLDTHRRDVAEIKRSQLCF